MKRDVIKFINRSSFGGSILVVNYIGSPGLDDHKGEASTNNVPITAEGYLSSPPTSESSASFLTWAASSTMSFTLVAP